MGNGVLDPLKDNIKIATFNPRGVNEPGKLDIIDGWAHQQKIMVIALQEPQISSNSTRRTAHYVWFFCTAVKTETLQKVDKLKTDNKKIDTTTRLAITEHLGVGFAVHISLVPAIANVLSFGNRLGILHLHAVTYIYMFTRHTPLKRNWISNRRTTFTNLWGGNGIVYPTSILKYFAETGVRKSRITK